ncbi:MAG: AMP-binding protein, partial [Sphingomonadaceae bacterium]|nr:AMP-binding protein [Sphingomonadaceae bacterium]
MSTVDLLAAEFGTFPELIRAHAAERAEAEAVIDGDVRLSFGDYDALGDRIAAALQRDGLAQGEAVAACGVNSWPYAALWLGVLRAGCVVAPLTQSSTPDALAMMVADCGARVVFADRAIAATLELPASVAVIPLDDGAAFGAWLAP